MAQPKNLIVVHASELILPASTSSKVRGLQTGKLSRSRSVVLTLEGYECCEMDTGHMGEM